MSQTPPNASVGPVFTLATWQQRVAGAVIDGLLALAIYIVGLGVGSALDSGTVTSLFWLLSVGFWIWQWFRQGTTGQTIGKGVMGIKLVRERDAQLTGAGVSIGRGFMHVIDWAVCLVGWFLPLFDARRQTIADKLVQTVVVEA